MASSNTNNVNQKEPQHQKQLLSKIAISNRHGEDSPYFDGWSAYRSNPYHPTRNPNGVLQMGLAENPLCLDLIQEWIQDNPHASICSAEGQGDFKDMAIFQDYHGLPEFRQAVAKFMTRVRGGPKNKVNFDPNRIVMSGGATGASETLIFCLADPGDAFLIPSPYYPAFDRDLRWRTGLELIPVPCNSSNGFKITTEALDQAYHQAINSNHKVKGMILANPSNPLGTILDRESLTSLVSFANNKQIHLVVDEIYSATVFRSPDIVSLAEIVAEEKSNDLNLDLFHITYSLSKDMGLPGFRVGIIYSYNDEVVNCARRMSSFGLVSSQTQHLLASMLSDEVFVDRFLAESRCRLATRHRKFTKGVGEVGISCLDSNAGLFVWMDLRHLLKSQSDDGELELWRTIINEVKINVSPGMSFHCSEAGWFRVCYANMDEDTLDVALTRIRSFVHKGKEQVNTHNKRSRTWQKNLRLSFGKSSSSMNGNGNGGASMRCDEDILSSPHLMSPHSPMPCSPLVKART